MSPSPSPRPHPFSGAGSGDVAARAAFKKNFVAVKKAKVAALRTIALARTL